ncbi:MAG: hypothetical protein ACQEP7_01660 [bacterium]
MYSSFLIIFMILFSIATAGFVTHPERKMKLIFLFFIFNSILLSIFTASYFLGAATGRFYVLVFFVVTFIRLFAGITIVHREENLKNE